MNLILIALIALVIILILVFVFNAGDILDVVCDVLEAIGGIFEIFGD